MAWGNFLKTALPVAAGIFGSPALGAAVGAGLEFWGSRRQAGAQERAAAEAASGSQQGYNYLANGPIGTDYVDTGRNALSMQANLLGLGDDPAAAEEAYQNYLNSIGFQSQLRAGNQAITAGAASGMARGSGATLKALTRYGQDLGQRSFGNYLASLRGLSDTGLQAGGMVGSAAGAAGAAGAGYRYAGATDAAASRREGFNALAGGLGAVYEGIRTRGKNPIAVAGTAPNMADLKGRMRGYA